MIEIIDQKEYCFSCGGELSDINYMYQLLMVNGVESKIMKLNNISNQMGLEEVLIVLFTSSTIPTILEIISIWLSNRKKELTIIDRNSNKEIHLNSKNGKAFTDLEMEKLFSFFEEKKDE